MKKIFKILNYSLIVLLVFSMAACAPQKKGSTKSRKKQTSHVNASQLGRNKYYFSSGYQKKLSKGYKTKR
ncbi:MAG TPA: hypothetical protein PL123_10140 [Bacteroidales bacterium]|nr:hypothetical protein [Bacteroidales bacterium]